jgi:hypothetical protein
MDKELSVITIIDIPKDRLDVKLGVNGGAVIRDDKMIGKLDEWEGQGYNFISDNISTGTLEITNPCDIDKFITLEIKKSKTKSEVSYYDNIVHLKKTIKLKVDFAEAQKSIILTDENMMKIQEKSEKNIKIACMALFEKYKGFEIDIFSIYQEVYKKYPKIKIEDIINKTELQLDVDVEIMNTGDTYNFN